MQSHINQPMDKQTIKQMYIKTHRHMDKETNDRWTGKPTDIWIKNKQTDINNQTARVTLYSEQ